MKYFFFLLLFTHTLFAGVQDHLKRVDKDGLEHSFSGIDFIYMINLDERPEKYEITMNELLPWGIFPQRFSAVNGWKLSIDVINDLGVIFDPSMKRGMKGTYFSEQLEYGYAHELIGTPGRSYFCHCMARGPIGAILSHLSILQDAWDCGYETIWVLEDDVEVLRDPKEITKIIKELDKKLGRKKWDILFTDRDTRNTHTGEYVPSRAAPKRPNYKVNDRDKLNINKPATENTRRIGARYGAYSMIINRNGMRKLLDFFYTYHLFLPYDIDYCYPKGIRLFTVLDDIVTFKTGSASDNGAPNYEKSR